MDKSGGGNGVGRRFACGWEMKNCITLFMDNMSAGKLTIPGICSECQMWLQKTMKIHNRFVFRVALNNNSDYAEVITLK